MDRKEFLGTLLVLPVGIFLVHCGSSDYSSDDSSGASDPNAPAAAPTKSGTQDVYSSSIVSSHFHTFTVDDASFSSPPASGVSGDSSSAGAHTHTVSISSDELQQVETGQSVTVTTGSAGGHTHVFTFMKVGTAKSSSSSSSNPYRYP